MASTVCDIGDCCVNTNDLALLKTPRSWLNDNLIGFYLEWAQRELPGRQQEAVVLHPSSSFMFRWMSTEDLIPDAGQTSNPFVRAAADNNVHVVFAPINDSADSFNAGGSHWSLLVVDKRARTAVHYDSCRPQNTAAARDTTSRFNELLYGGQGEGEGRGLTFVEATDCEQQSNGYDCGVFTLINFDRLYFNRTPSSSPVAQEFRARLLELVLAEQSAK